MTLSKALVPSQSLLTRALMVAGGSAFIALAAQVSVPMLPVPMTLQTLAILLVGFAFGARMGVATLLAYLAEGAMGLPVFANGMNGIAFFGPTRSEEHTSELQSRENLVCRLLLEKKK